MKKDMISIIVSCYNVSKFLDDCFKSIENQTYKNIEVIFVNDGSKDDTLERIKKFCEGKNYCKYIDQENQGPSQARNNGLALAQGEFIYFLDSDDIPYPNILEELRKMIEGYDISICSFRKMSENVSYSQCKKYFGKKIKNIEVFNGTEDILVQFLCVKKFFPNVWTKLYRHEILKKMKTYPNIFKKEVKSGEDVLFNTEFLSLCSKVAFTPCKLYLYRQRKGSLTNDRFNTNDLSILTGHNLNIESCKNFPKALDYAKGFKCIDAYSILKKMLNSSFDDKEVFKAVYKDYIDNLPYLKKSKKFFFWTKLECVMGKKALKRKLSKKIDEKLEDCER